MARTQQQVYNQIVANKVAEPALSGLTSKSKVAIYNLWMWLTAASIVLLEQVLDIYKTDLESQIVKAGAGTLPWVRDRVLEFQTGYNVVYNAGVISYTTIDTTAQIISRCSVTQSADKVVNIKVATGEPPIALSTPQTTELFYYLQQIDFAGVQVNIITGNADQLYILADVYFNGQLTEDQIQTNVPAALNAYCAGLDTVDNFNGDIIISAIETAIKNATGVQYLKLNEIGIRADGTPFADRQILYSLSSGIDIPKSETVSGYVIGETTSGSTFSDSITYIPV